MPLARPPDLPLTAHAGIVGRWDWSRLAPTALLAMLVLLAFRHVVRPLVRAFLATPARVPVHTGATSGLPIEDRSPGFRRRLAELTGRTGESGDPLAGALEENLDEAGRTLGDWIGRR